MEHPRAYIIIILKGTAGNRLASPPGNTVVVCDKENTTHPLALTHDNILE